MKHSLQRYPSSHLHTSLRTTISPLLKKPRKPGSAKAANNSSRRAQRIPVRIAASLIRRHHLTVRQYQYLRKVCPLFPPYQHALHFLRKIPRPALGRTTDKGAAVNSLLEVLSFLFNEAVTYGQGSFTHTQFPRSPAFRTEGPWAPGQHLLMLRFTSDGFLCGLLFLSLSLSLSLFLFSFLFTSLLTFHPSHTGSDGMETFQVCLLNDPGTVNAPQHQGILALWQHSREFNDKHEEWNHWCGHLITELQTLTTGIFVFFFSFFFNFILNKGTSFIVAEGMIYKNGRFHLRTTEPTVSLCRSLCIFISDDLLIYSFYF